MPHSIVLLCSALLAISAFLPCARAQIAPAYAPETEIPVFSAWTNSFEPKLCPVEEGELQPKDGCAVTQKPQSNALIRVRFHNPLRKMSAILVLRSAVGKNPGLGLEIDGLRARFLSIRGKQTSPIGGYSRLLSIWGEEVELVVLQLGELALAQLYQADRLNPTHLGTVATLKAPMGPGELAFLKSSKGLRVMSASSRPACQSSFAPGDRGPDFVLLFDANVHPRERPGIAWLENRPSDERNLYRFDAPGLEELFCEQQTPAPIDFLTELPWKYLDRGYMLQRNLPPSVTPEGALETDLSYKDPKMVEQFLRQWAQRHPELAQVEILGKTHEGRPLVALKVGRHLQDPAGLPVFFFNGAHHGSEVISVEFVIDLLGELIDGRQRPEIARILNEAIIYALPAVNPDSLDAFFNLSNRSSRKNRRDVNHDGQIDRGEGVDLNRNYPFRFGALGRRGSQNDPMSAYYRGDKPASEPETQAIIALAKREQFTGSISYHTGAIQLLAPYTIDGVKQPEPNESWSIGEALCEKIPAHPEGRQIAVARKLYPVDGTDQDWHRHEHGTLAYILEGAIWAPKELEKRKAIVETIRPAWRFLVERFLNGPSLSVQVVDAQGRPVKAEVRVLEQKLNADEHWTTRCKDGYHHRYLDKPGLYHLLIRTPGQKDLQKEVEVLGHETVKIQLPSNARGQARCR